MKERLIARIGAAVSAFVALVILSVVLLFGLSLSRFEQAIVLIVLISYSLLIAFSFGDPA